MVEPGSLAKLGIDSEMNFITDLDPPLLDLSSMNCDLRRWVLCIDDLHSIAARGFYCTPIAHLPARLAVKRGGFNDKIRFFFFVDFFFSLSVVVDGEDL